MFTGLIVAAFLMFMARALHFLPQAALGAIIIVAIVKLLDFRRLFSANASYFEEELLRVLEACPESRYIGIDAKGINSIDATRVDLISALVLELRQNGVELIFCGLKPAVLGPLRRGGVIAQIGEQNLYPHLNAVQKGSFSRADVTG